MESGADTGGPSRELFFESVVLCMNTLVVMADPEIPTILQEVRIRCVCWGMWVYLRLYYSGREGHFVYTTPIDRVTCPPRV